MITDIFSRRYATVPIAKGFYEEDRRFMAQVAKLIQDPLWTGTTPETPSDFAEKCLKQVHDQLATEFGLDFLSDRWWFNTYTWNGNQRTNTHTNTYVQICRNYLVKPLTEGADPDRWVKDRLSLIELAFRTRWLQVQEANTKLPAILESLGRTRAFPTSGLRVPGDPVKAAVAGNERLNRSFLEVADELNGRLKLADIPVEFHNGMLQLAGDPVSDQHISQPFWPLVADEKWRSVDEQMKDALDRRDRGDRTAAFHAICAVESAVKIISASKGWDTGNERGAAQYVDNLVSRRNGRFIEPWEAEAMKRLFADVRNMFAHGPGGEPLPNLSSEQTDWAIDSAMAWVKRLVRAS